MYQHTFANVETFRDSSFLNDLVQEEEKVLLEVLAAMFQELIGKLVKPGRFSCRKGCEDLGELSEGVGGADLLVKLVGWAVRGISVQDVFNICQGHCDHVGMVKGWENRASLTNEYLGEVI